MTKSRILFFLLCFSFFSAKAQLSNDLIQFANDLEQHISKSGNPSATEAVADFVGYYTANQLTNPQKIQVIKLCNTLIQKNTGIGVMDNFLRSMNGLIESGQGSKLEKWLKAAVLAQNKSKDAFANFVAISKNVFQDHIVTRMGVMTWVTDNAEVEMDLKSDDPAFTFRNMNLYCYTPGDTVIIKQTSGKYYAASNQWVGEGGLYWWTRVDLDSADIYAELKRYTINLTTGSIRADTAYLHYPSLFSERIPGTLIDKPMVQSMGSRSMYPQFESHRKNFTHISFGKGKLTGAFGLKGRVLIGKGVDSAKAELVFNYQNKPIFKIRANEFMVRENKVGTKKAEVIVYLDKDSIYHPQIEFSYRLDNHKLQVYRNDEGISSAPFYDTYHNIEFYADELRWDLINPKIDVDMINDNEPAKFESVNYFRDLRYERVQGILDYNPLQRIKLYCEKRDIKGFFIQDYAANFRANLSDIRIQMIWLHDRGYINYNFKTDYVQVRRKLSDYVNAHFGKTDFDAIAFYSIIKRYPNASISLINNDLQVQGVPRFQFSDSQNVYIVPKDQILTLKKNRNMDLAGKVRAGKVDFYGTGFTFDYTTFQIRMNNVDSMRFFLYDESTGSDIPIKSAIQNVYGTLAIDYPGNKSGRKRYPAYPYFKSDIGSKIYYDKPSTQQGVYDRARFYFDVDPFTIDSLNTLNFETLALDGTLISGGIVPDIRHEVYLQPDRSLGFVLGKPAAPYPLYGGKGSGDVVLSLSDEGFYGNGEMRYLSSLSTSEQFLFLLDSMNASCQSFTNERTTIYPSAMATGVYEHWVPYRDSLYVYSLQQQIKVSEERVRLDGVLHLTPTRMSAAGVNHIRGAELLSANFWMQPDKVLADSSRLRLRNYTDSSKFAFYSGSVKADVDLNAWTGLFVYNEPGINTDFNYNLYQGSFKQFTWRIEDKTLDFESHTENGKDISYLLSSRPSQDSLKFVSGLTRLDLKDFTLYAQKIPFIAIGDAWLFPDSAKVIIRAEANMDEVSNAKITADTVLKYHSIEKVRMTVLGRFNIVGTGNYQYTDKDKTIQQFFLEEIKIDEQHRLYGKTNIPDSANFTVGPRIAFRGHTVLKSINKNLEYAGHFLAKHELPYPKTDWFRNSAIINPDSVYLIVDTMQQNLIRQALMCGINVSNDSTHVYPLFFSRKRNGSDPELMRVSGTLIYDEKLKLFKFGPHEKVFGHGRKGNYMELSEGKKNIYYEGRFRFGLDNSSFTMKAAGNAIYNYADTTFRMKLMMLIDFPFPEEALKIMYDTINIQSSGTETSEFDESLFAKALSDLVSDDKALNKVLEELPDKTILLDNELKKPIYLSSILLRWNQPTRSFISEGDINLNSIDKYKIERKMNGRLELTKKRSGDDLTLYIITPEGSWYFFKYQRGILFALSSDPLYNLYIKNNIDKISKKDKNFALRLANYGDRNKFVRRMKAQK